MSEQRDCVVCGKPESTLRRKYPEIPLCSKHSRLTLKRICPKCSDEAYVRRPPKNTDESIERFCKDCNRIVENEKRAAQTQTYEPDDDPENRDYSEVILLERKLTRARDELRTTRAKLRQAHRDEGLFEQCAAVIRESTRPLDPVRVRAEKPQSGKYPVDALMALGDEHADSVVNSATSWGMEVYNFDVYRCRMERWAEIGVDFLTHHLPRHRFETLWVVGLGDALQGDIHDMKHRNHFENTIDAALAVGDTRAQALQWIHAEVGIPIVFIGLSGNHTRRGKRKDMNSPTDNFDFLVTAQMATRLANQPGITVSVPRSWTAFAQIRNSIWAFNHGDTVRGWAGFPFYGFDRRNNRIQTVLAREQLQIHYFLYGHWHQLAETPSAGGRSFHNGAFPARDAYSTEQLAAYQDPTQYLFVIDDDRGMILPVPLYLKDKEKEAKCLAGEYQPKFGTDLIIDELNVPQRDGFQLIQAGAM